MSKQIPARYMLEHEGLLMQAGGPYKDGDGFPLQSLVLRKGDVILVNEHEVKGHTILKDPRGERDMENLGVGRVVKKEHQNLSDAELETLGYEFHQGSPMWEDASAKPDKKVAKADTKQEGAK
ncbi:MAG: hypothetical protein NVS4B1_33460 [Ktedonobacteraceae bacterium]